MSFGSAAVLTFVTKLITFAITAATAIILARWLGPAARGEYAILTLVSSALVIASNLGLGTAIAVFVGRQPAIAPRVLSGALVFGASAGLVAWAGALLSLPLWSNAIAGVPPLLIGAVIFSALPALLYQLLISLLQGLRDFRGTSALIVASYVFVLALQLVLVVVLGLGLTGAIAAWVTAHAGIALAAFVVVRRAVKPGPLDRKLFGAQLRIGAPTYLSTISWLVLSRASLFACGLLLPSADVGRYAVALTFVEILLYAADSVVFALTPHAAAAGPAVPYASTPLASRAVMLVASIGALMLLFGAQPLVVLLFGEAFAPAANAVRWLLPGIVAASIARVLVADLIARDHAWPGLGALSVGALAGLATAAPLVALARIDGAAAAWSFGHIVAALAVMAAYARISAVGPAALLLPRRSDIALALAFARRRLR